MFKNLTKKQWQLFSLRILEIGLIILFLVEAYTAVKMLHLNFQIINNESLRGVQSIQEVYTEKYNELQATKEAFKEANLIAGMIFPMRLALYVATAISLITCNNTCEKLTKAIHRELRSRRIKVSSRVA